MTGIDIEIWICLLFSKIVYQLINVSPGYISKISRFPVVVQHLTDEVISSHGLLLEQDLPIQ